MGGSGTDRQFSGVLGTHGINRVANKIGDDLADFSLEQGDRGDIPEAANYGYGVGPQAGFIESDYGFDQFPNVGFNRAGALAIEAERLGGNVDYSIQLLLGDLEVLAGRVVHLCLAHEVHAIGHGFERIVDFMRNGRGKATCGGQLFGALKDLFAALLFSQVSKEGHELALLGRRVAVETGCSEEYRDGRAVAGAAFDLERFTIAAGPALQQRFPRSGRAEDAVESDGSGLHFCLRIAEEPLDALVGKDDASAGVADEQGEWNGLNEAVKALLTAAEGAFCLTFYAAFGGFSQFTVNCRNQPGKILLCDIVMRPGTHGGNRGFLIHGAGHHDEGHVEPGR